MTPEPIGETPVQFTRSLVFFAALRAALDEGCTREFALDFARDCSTSEYGQVVRNAAAIAVRLRHVGIC